MFYFKKLPPKKGSKFPVCELYYDGNYNWILEPLPDDIDVTSLTKIEGEFEEYTSGNNTYIRDCKTEKQIGINALLGPVK